MRFVYVGGFDEIDYYIKILEMKSKRAPQFVDQQLQKNEGWILQKLKLRLWNRGIDGLGNPIIAKDTTPEAQAQYKAYKRKMGHRASHTTLHWSGEFYKSMKIISNRGVIFIDATNINNKKDDLISKFGEDILSLTQKEQRWLIDEFLSNKFVDWLEEN